VLVAVREAYGDAHQRMLPLGETFEDAAATPGATWSSLRARLRSSRSTLDKVGCHPLGQALGRERYEPTRGRAHSRCLPGHGKPDSPPEFARRHVDSRAPDEG
jgi:hypothetical protein